MTVFAAIVIYVILEICAHVGSNAAEYGGSGLGATLALLAIIVKIAAAVTGIILWIS